MVTMTWDDVDEDSQCRRQRVDEVAAGGSDRWSRQCRNQPDDRTDDVELRARKHGVGRRNTSGSMPAPMKPWIARQKMIWLKASGRGPHQPNREAGRRDREQIAGAERARHEPENGMRDHLGDQIRGLVQEIHRSSPRARYWIPTATTRRSACPDRHEHRDHEEEMPPDAAGRRSPAGSAGGVPAMLAAT